MAVTEKMRNECKVRDNGRCRACGMTDWESLQADHIIPRARGGKDTLDNLQTLCYVCNTQIKQDHPVGELAIQPKWDAANTCAELDACIATGRQQLRELVAQCKIDEWAAIEAMVAQKKSDGVNKVTIRKQLEKLVRGANKIQELLDK